MLHYLKGRLVEKSPVHAVIDCNGVAYLLQISLFTYERIPNDEICRLFTHFHINSNDFSLVLYGFYEEQERDIFRKLISVSGVGPNTARMVLSSMNPDGVRQAIGNKDVASLKRIKGIGEKTAERIIVDLHDKISRVPEGVSIEKSSVPYNLVRSEALAALASLGLEKTKTEKLLDKLIIQLGQDVQLEELIRQALKQL